MPNADTNAAEEWQMVPAAEEPNADTGEPNAATEEWQMVRRRRRRRGRGSQ